MRRKTIAALVALVAAGCASSEGGEPGSRDFDPAGLDGLAAPDAGSLYEGELVVYVHDALDGSVRYFYYLDTDDGTRYELAFDEPRDDLAALISQKARLRVRGTAEGRKLSVSRIESADAGFGRHTLDQALGEAEATTAALVQGNRTAAVILIGFQGTPNTFDPERMRAAVFDTTGNSSSTFYLEGSRGATRLMGIQNPEQGDVFGPYTVSYTDCNQAGNGDENRGNEAIGTQARQMADADGANTSAYDHIIHYLAPVSSGCAGGGVAGGSGYTWIFGVGINSAWDYIAHEVGHNFGLPHSSWYTGATANNGGVVTYNGSTTNNEYGDPTDIMGRRNFMFSSFHLERLGWLQPQNALLLEESARVLLSPIETASNGVQSLRVARNGSGNDAFFHFEYRQKLGQFDAGLETELTSGVLVRIVGATTGRSTGNPHLLDMTPGSRSGDNDTIDAALVPGMTLQDGDMQAEVVEVTPEAATIDITLGGVPPDTGDPIGTGGMPAGGSGGTGTTAGGAGGTGTTAGGSGGTGTTAGGTGGAVTGSGGVAGTGTAVGGAGGGAATGTTATGTGGATAASSASGVGGATSVGGSGVAIGTTGTGGASNPTGGSATTGGDKGGCACRMRPEPRAPANAALLVAMALGACLRRRRRPAV